MTIKYKPSQLKQARKDAGHSINQASVYMGISVNLVVNFELRGEEPKSVHLQTAIENYITKNLKKEGRSA